MATSSTEEKTASSTMAPGPLTTGVDPITGRPNLLPRSPLVYNTDSEDSNDSDSTIDRDIRDNMEIIMWNTLASPQSSPIVRSQLHRAGIILQTNDGPRDNTSTVMRDHFMAMTLTPPIQLDSFTPTLAASNDHHNYLWFTWLTESQYGQFVLDGTVPGYKDTRSDNVHKHQRLHNTPEHCINLHIHNRWNAAPDSDNYGSNKPIYLL
eukprot:6222356-Amphidinium_carterae.1